MVSTPQITITAPSILRGTVNLPASKSISNRALILAALAGGNIMPENIAHCDDTDVMVRALNNDNCIEDINDTETLNVPVVDIMAAGTAMRFLTAYFCVTPGIRIITGTERMRNRPIAVLIDALRTLGADIEYVEKEGFPPLKITGKQLKGGSLSLPGNVSSQYISALLMIAPTLAEGLSLRLTGGIVSRPYIDMTLCMMRSYGAVAEWTDETCITVKGNGYTPTHYYIENDWSASSYWYEMVALSADEDARITLPGLFEESLQGDQAIKDIFLPLGIETSFSNDGVVLTKTRECTACATTRISKAVTYNRDLTRQPDLAQTVIVTCCLMGQPFVFGGLQTLRIKETDRVAALEKELAKWGFEVTDLPPSPDRGLVMQFDGKHTPVAGGHTANIDTYDDHRMAMAFAPSAMVMPSVTINNPQVVTKSYPGYWDDLKSVGFEII